MCVSTCIHIWINNGDCWKCLCSGICESGIGKRAGNRIWLNGGSSACRTVGAFNLKNKRTSSKTDNQSPTHLLMGKQHNMAAREKNWESRKERKRKRVEVVGVKWGWKVIFPEHLILRHTDTYVGHTETSKLSSLLEHPRLFIFWLFENPSFYFLNGTSDKPFNL